MPSVINTINDTNPNIQTEKEDDDEWYQEEMTCILDVPQENIATIAHQDISISDLDSSNPKMVIGSHSYKIQFDKTVGTDLIFQSPNDQGENAAFVCSTETKLLASRIIAKEK